MNIKCSYSKELSAFLNDIVQYVLSAYAQELDLSNLEEIELYKKESFQSLSDGRTVEHGTRIILSSRLIEQLPCYCVDTLLQNPNFMCFINTLYHEMGHVNDWTKMPILYGTVSEENDVQDIMVAMFWLEYIAEKRSYMTGLSRTIHKEYCEDFIRREWKAKEFDFQRACESNYFYLVKATSYFMARSSDYSERKDYLRRVKNPLLRDFIEDLDKELKKLEECGQFDGLEPLVPLSQIIFEYWQIFSKIRYDRI